MSILSNGNTPINAADSTQAALAALFQQGDVIEIRALGVPMGRMKGTTAGYFDNSDDAVRAACELSNRSAEGVYVCVNPVKLGCLARAENKLKDGLKPTTSDKDIDCRRWFFTDVDYERPSGICATDAEKESANAVALLVWNWLTTELGWPHPLLLDSGNGSHLLSRIDLPNTTETDELVKAILIAIQNRFATEYVKIDQSVANAARVIRLSGTWNRKGDNTGDRPHRLAKPIYVPSTISTVSLDQLQAVADLAPKSAASTVGNGQSRLDVPAWLIDRGLLFTKARLQDGRDAWGIICPFDSSHGLRGETIITQEPGGKLGAICHHASCSGRGWQEFRDAIGPPDATRWSGGAASTAAKLITLRGDEIKRQPLEWLWLGRIPIGKLTMFIGDPGLGKSLVSLNIGATVTRGDAWPDRPGYPQPDGSVLIFSAEDDQEDTIMPRLDQAGSVPSRVRIVKAVDEGNGRQRHVESRGKLMAGQFSSTR